MNADFFVCLRKIVIFACEAYASSRQMVYSDLYAFFAAPASGRGGQRHYRFRSTSRGRGSGSARFPGGTTGELGRKTSGRGRLFPPPRYADNSLSERFIVSGIVRSKPCDQTAPLGGGQAVVCLYGRIHHVTGTCSGYNPAAAAIRFRTFLFPFSIFILKIKTYEKNLIPCDRNVAFRNPLHRAVGMRGWR